MKKIYLLWLVLLGLGCQNAKKDNSTVRKDSVTVQQKDDSIKDTVGQRNIAVVFYGDTMNFTERDLYLAKKTIPQFSENFFQNPDEAYATRGMGYEPKGEEEKEFSRFACEVCQDDYYLMYTYFLSQKIDLAKYKNEGKTLISIFRLINEFNRALQSGGTYFGHQYQRIYAYATYAVYIYGKQPNEKSYPADKEKKFFIGGLKQKVLDDEQYNFDAAVDVVAKKKRKEELLKLVYELDQLITDHFYLEEAQEFQYSHY